MHNMSKLGVNGLQQQKTTNRQKRRYILHIIKWLPGLCCNLPITMIDLQRMHSHSQLQLTNRKCTPLDYERILEYLEETHPVTGRQGV